jgi:hypothetical protein
MTAGLVRRVDEQVVERKARGLVGTQEGVGIDLDEAVDHGIQIDAAAASSYRAGNVERSAAVAGRCFAGDLGNAQKKEHRRRHIDARASSISSSISSSATWRKLRPSGRRMPGRLGLASNSLLTSSKSCSSEKWRRQGSKMLSWLP